jgi:hypothetical protein
MNTKNKKLGVILLLIIVALLVYIAIKPRGTVGPIEEKAQTNVEPQVEGHKDDLISFSILPHSEVKGLISYRGVIKGAYFFEANILINILDSNKHVLKKSNAMATTDWMTIEPVSFEGNIDFSGVPKGPAYIEIHNDNASGLPENDKSILIPVVIK